LPEVRRRPDPGPAYVHESWTSKERFPVDSINTILQDRTGYIRDLRRPLDITSRSGIARAFNAVYSGYATARTAKPYMSPPSPADTTWARAFSVFDEAIFIADPIERERLVAAACEGDASLIEAVRRLLDADSTDSALLDTPAAVHAADLADALDEPYDDSAAAERVVGPYRIVRELGRGGMGVVYLAEREDVPMRVALKLVRGGLAAPDHLERFLIERRVLARLEHPNIARLLDAGVESDGTPWFAMEYVEGLAIDDFCAECELGIPERLALFERVCEAVQFAHRNLIVHRDLKPSNVLVVASSDGSAQIGHPKLLDFGIAKLLGDDDDAGMTATHMRLMTPEYAAPEQVRGQAITTATDVYALGVVLYELLTGRRPYELRDASIEEIAHAVLEKNPTRPSAVVATPRERKQLSGDLDTIVGKALEKEPSRRYESAESLLRDLRRHREGRAVSARPATLGYRTRTFVRRNRTLVAVALGTVVLLAGFGVATAYQNTQITRALHHAEAETNKARDVTRILVDMFRDADPFQTTGPDSVRGLSIDVAMERVDRELAGQPEMRAELVLQLAVIDNNLGRFVKADTALRRVIGEVEALQSTNANKSLRASLYYQLGATLRAENAFASAETFLQHSLTLRRELALPDDPELAVTLNELGAVRRYQGRYDEASRLFEETVRIMKGRGDTETLASALARLSDIYAVAGDIYGADSLARQALAIRERLLGPDHPSVASGYLRLANVLSGIDADSAMQAAEHAFDIDLRRLGPAHPSTLSAESELSLLEWRKGDVAKGERLQREVLAGRSKLYGENHIDVGGSLANLAFMMRKRGDLANAEAYTARAAQIYQNVTGIDENVAGLVLQLAVLKAKLGDTEDAVQVAKRVVGFKWETIHNWDTATADDLVETASLLATASECVDARTLYARANAMYDGLGSSTRARPKDVKAFAACRIPLTGKPR
jgi:tetratricopeptide (TPR) repeat protein